MCKTWHASPLKSYVTHSIPNADTSSIVDSLLQNLFYVVWSSYKQNSSFDVLLTVHLSIISVINQLDVQSIVL